MTDTDNKNNLGENKPQESSNDHIELTLEQSIYSQMAYDIYKLLFDTANNKTEIYNDPIIADRIWEMISARNIQIIQNIITNLESQIITYCSENNIKTCDIVYDINNIGDGEFEEMVNDYLVNSFIENSKMLLYPMVNCLKYKKIIENDKTQEIVVEDLEDDEQIQNTINELYELLNTSIIRKLWSHHGWKYNLDILESQDSEIESQTDNLEKQNELNDGDGHNDNLDCIIC